MDWFRGADDKGHSESLADKRLTIQKFRVYNLANAATTAGGIGVPVDTAARAAFDLSHAAFCIVAPFMVAHSRSLRARQLLLRSVTGTPTRLGCRPDWRLDGSCYATDTSEATMADISTDASALLASDLMIEITPRWICRFRGTRAQLVAEGLVPEDFKWPPRTQRKKWEAGNFKFWTMRCRPYGIKGRQSVWSGGDYWVLDMSLKSGLDVTAYCIEKKTTALAEIVRGKSSAWSEEGHLAYKAKQDHKYMAFRNLLLGDLAPRKRGRPAKSSTTESSPGATP